MPGSGIPAAHQSKQRAVSPFEARPQYVSPSDVSKATVLSSAEMQSLTRTAYAPPSHAVQDQREKRNTLRNKSQNRYKNWGNTIEANRNKKLAQKQKKCDDMEAAQQILDEEERQHRDRERRATIERANRILFQQQDKVKEFQSSMIYSKVLAERADQIDMHRRKQEFNKQMDRMWEVQSLEQLNYANRVEEEKELQRKSKSVELANMQKRQLRMHQEHLYRERQREIEEGQWLQQLAQDAIVEEEQVQAAAKAKRVQNQADLVRANQETQKIRAQRALLEAREEQRIIEFAKKKEKKDQLRKEQIAAKLAAKQAMYEKMVAVQAANLEKIHAEEQARQNKHAAALEAAQEQREVAERENIEIRKQQIKRSREEQLLRKARDLETQKIEDAIMAQEWARRTEAMQQLGIEEERAVREKNILHAKELQQQRSEKKAAERLEKFKDLEAARIYRERMAKDDETYMQYTEEQIRDSANKGRSVVPMKLCLVKQRRREKHIGV